ncbi:sensor domain-containing diguanylate cyclase [Congregibacter sp.]|uniref:sensor domain-containing diguanylate cyclase n=1 Tax=Congregibacter sp. TaxID=2744308 RepID=UPI003F6D71FA
MNPEHALDTFFAQLFKEHGPEAITESLHWLGAFVITEDSIIVAANPAFCELLEVEHDDIIGVAAFDVITPDEQSPMHERFAHDDTNPYELKLRLADGRIKHVVVTPHSFSIDDRTYRLAAFTDVSEYVHIKDAETRFKKVFAAAGIGIARVNPDGSWLECNEKVCEIVGYSEEELLQKTFQDITHPDDLNEDLQYVEEMLAGTRTTYSMDKRYLHKQGHYVWIRLTVTLVDGADGQPQYFVSLIQDISAEKQAAAAIELLNEKLAELSLTDGLTSVGNRRKFDTALENEWRRARRHGTGLALILIDIDNFKSYNDDFGHLAGDDCLKQVAGAIQEYGNRVSDCVARYGGEEFALLLPGKSLQEAVVTAEKCRESIERLRIPRKDDSPRSVVTISLGVAEITPGAEDGAEMLIDAADHRLYEAKSSGRNNVKPSLEDS